MTYATDALVAPTLVNGATATAVDPVNCWQTAVSEPPGTATADDGTVVTTTEETACLNSLGIVVVQTGAGTITPTGETPQPFQVTLSTVTDPSSGATTQYSSDQPLVTDGGILVTDTGGSTVLTSDGQGNQTLTQDGQLRFATSAANQTLTTYTVENGDPVAQAVLPFGGEANDPAPLATPEDYATPVFDVNTGGLLWNAGANVWGLLHGSLSLGAGYANPPQAGGGGYVTLDGAGTIASAAAPGHNYQIVTQWLDASPGDEYCNTVLGRDFQLQDGQHGVGVGGGSSNVALTGTPGSTWDVRLVGMATTSVTDTTPTTPSWAWFARLTWNVQDGDPRGYQFTTVTPIPGIPVADMPGAVGNSITLKPPAAGTKFTTTIRVTIPQSGVTPILASIAITLKNKGRCQFQVITSIDATVTYVSGPSSEQIQTQGQTHVQTTDQTSTVPRAAARLQQIKAVWALLFPMFEAAIDPQNQVHSIAVQLSACSAFLTVANNVMANNGGTLLGFTAAMVNSAMTQVLQAYNMSVTPVAEGGGDEGIDLPPTLPDGTVDTFVAFSYSLLGFLESHVVTPNS